MGMIKFLITVLAIIWALVYVLKGLRPGSISNFQPIKALKALAVLIVVFAVVSTFQVIPAGHRGVVFSQAQGVEKRILGEGIAIVVPFLESVTLIDVRIGKREAVGSAASKDLQNVQVSVLVNYHPLSSKVNAMFQNIGDREAVEAKIIEPSVQESIKAVTPRFTAAEIIQKRHEVKQTVFEQLSKRMEKNYLVLDDISIVDIQFDVDFTRAIEEKVKQEQVYQKELLVVKTKEAQAQQLIAEAEGIKQSTILKAEGKAQENKLLSASITPLVLQQIALEKWDGQVPTYVAGDGTNALIQIPTPQP